MSWDPKTGGSVSSIQRSEYEQLLTPNRSQMLTANAVQFPSNESKQGAAAIQPNSSSQLLSGSTGSPFPVFARWW